MGDVAITFKVMPDGLEVDLAVLRASVQKVAESFGKVHKLDEKPVAFGLKAVMVTVVMPDKTAKPDALEEKLGEIEGVQSVNTEALGLI